MNVRSIFFILPVAFLAGCAAKSGFEPYAAQANAKKEGQASYRVADVVLELSGDPANGSYPDQAGLQEVFKNALTEEVSGRQLAGNSFDLNVRVSWNRRMWRALEGMAASESRFSSAGCQIESRIMQDGKVLAVDQGDPLNAGSILYNQKNFLNNLKRIGNNMTGTGNVESEQRELKRCAKLLAERLPN